MKKLTSFLTHKTIATAIYWGYNLLFLLFIFLATFYYLSTFPKASLQSFLTLGGSVPGNVLVMIYLFMLTPPLMLFIGLLKPFRVPQNLLKAFFGIQIPLMGLTLIRIVFLRQLTPILWLFTLSVFASIIGLLFHFFYPRINSKVKLSILLLTQLSAVIVSIYVALLGLFFLPIVVAFIWNFMARGDIFNIFRPIVYSFQQGRFLDLALSIVFLTILNLTALFFTISPLAAIGVFWNNLVDLYSQFAQQFSQRRAKYTTISFSIIFIFTSLALSVQPNSSWYQDKIKRFQQAKSFDQRELLATDLLRDQAAIKNSLVTSYLAKYRYLTDSQINILEQGYKNELKASEDLATTIQKAFQILATPFVYQGIFDEDVKKASQDYQDLFDNPIQRGEKQAIVGALKQTNTQDPIKATLLDLDKQTVRVVSKQVSVNTDPENLFAKVTIEEEYQNSTKLPQEVYYEFSLPQDSVLVDFKLGPDLEFGASGAISAHQPILESTSSGQKSSNLVEKGDSAIVAPKGAANQTYEAQVRYRIDPALLEQTGPRQYRVRIFPIQPDNTFVNGSTAVLQKPQKSRLSYLTLVTLKGVALPNISQKRNVFTDSKTTQSYFLNSSKLLTKGDPELIPLDQSNCQTKPILQSDTPGGNIYFVPYSLLPTFKNYYSCQEGLLGSLNKSVSGLKIALMLDSSYSNKQKDWNSYLERNFPIQKLVKENKVDLYYFNEYLSPGSPLTEDSFKRSFNIANIGKTNRLQALQSLPQVYDLVLMVTDDGLFDPPSKTNQSLSFPVYIIHTSQNIPSYNDALSSFIFQNGGKLVNNGFEALDHYWLTHLTNLDTNLKILDANEVGFWFLQPSLPSTLAIQPTISLDFRPLAVKKYLESSLVGSNLTDNAVLDKLNLLATQTSIVTPFSSMVVLINDQQKEQLRKASGESDRYRVAYNIGDEDLLNPSGSRILNIGSVPEPEEWLLIFTSLGLLLYFNRQRLLLRYGFFKYPSR